MASPNAAEFRANICTDLVATIADGAATTAEIDLGGTQLVGFFFPASMTSATLTITVAPATGGTFVPLQKDELGGGVYTVTVTSSKYVPVSNLAITAGARFVKIVTSGNETGAKSITLATRPV